MDRQEVLGGLLQELRRGIIVLCVLGRLREPMYGYSLVTALSEAGIAVEANTLYPLLRRLESQGLLQSSWETGGPKPRKYYAVTGDGAAVYETMRRQWNEMAQSVNTILEDAADEK